MTPPTPPPPAPGNRRYHGLDAIRAVMMTLGLVLHVALCYGEGDWIYKDPETTGVAGLITVSVHVFRMPIFFVMAGFFGAMVYERRGAAIFARQRFDRIVVPLVIGWFVLFPLLSWAIIFAWTHTSFPPEAVGGAAHAHHSHKLHTVDGDRELVAGIAEAAARLADSLDNLATEAARLRARVPRAVRAARRGERRRVGAKDSPPLPPVADGGDRFVQVEVIHEPDDDAEADSRDGEVKIEQVEVQREEVACGCDYPLIVAAQRCVPTDGDPEPLVD